MTVWLGRREVQVIHIGRSHTAGDTVVWLPKERVLFSGDVVEFGATPYCGDAHFTDWPATLEAARALGAEALVPGRGRSLMNRRGVRGGDRGDAGVHERPVRHRGAGGGGRRAAEGGVRRRR